MLLWLNSVILTLQLKLDYGFHLLQHTKLDTGDSTRS